MGTTVKIPKDEKKITKVKELLKELKEEDIEEKCLLRTTVQPSEKYIQKLQNILNKKIEVEIIDKDKYLGGAEILCDGKLYSNLVILELEKVKAHLKNERDKESH